MNWFEFQRKQQFERKAVELCAFILKDNIRRALLVVCWDYWNDTTYHIYIYIYIYIYIVRQEGPLGTPDLL